MGEGSQKFCRFRIKQQQSKEIISINTSYFWVGISDSSLNYFVLFYSEMLEQASTYKSWGCGIQHYV